MDNKKKNTRINNLKRLALRLPAVFLCIGIQMLLTAPAVSQTRDVFGDKPGKPVQSPPAGQNADGPTAANPGRTPANTIRVTVQEAILMALENNRTLAIERLNPRIFETFEKEQQAIFDPVLTAQIAAERERSERARTGGGRDPFTSDTIAAEAALEQFFPAGTAVQVGGSAGHLETSQNADPLAQSRLELSVTQALLRGYGAAVNLANVRQSRLDTDASLYELRGFAEALLSQVETAYWDYALAKRQIVIVAESLHLAEQQMKDTEEMINVGRVAESELVATEAAIASRRQELIEARSALDVSRLRFLRLLNPQVRDPFKQDVELLSRPDFEQAALDDVDAHVAVAVRMRPDINQAKLNVDRDELEVVKTKNGLLPRMDFFITLGKSGYADSFGGSAADISGDSYDALAGVRFEYPLKNRGAQARHRRSLLNRDQAQLALENLSQLVELDVRAAFIEVQRARQQIAASSETRKLDEEKLRIETEKFKVGRSTNFLVDQAQRDLLLSQLVEVRSLASYLKALTELFRLEGSLLERRGISAPGGMTDRSLQNN